MMSNLTWLILTGEFPPDPGGVSDYTGLLSQRLSEAGDNVYVAAPFSDLARAQIASSPTESPSPQIIFLADRYGVHGLAQLSELLARLPPNTRILVQYVPHAFGFKAMNLLLCAWLAMQSHPVDLMFHEVAMPIERGQPLRHSVLGVVHRGMAFALVRAVATRTFVSTEAWRKLLSPMLGLGQSLELASIPSNLPEAVNQDCVKVIRNRLTPEGGPLVGYFGHGSLVLREMLCRTLARVLELEPSTTVLIVSREASAVRNEILSTHRHLSSRRIVALSHLTASDAAHHVAACDVMVQPYPDGISTRRSSAMASMALGIAMVTTRGSNTESLWERESLVTLSRYDASETAAAAIGLLCDTTGKRQAVGERARAYYRCHFTFDETVHKLRDGIGLHETPGSKFAPKSHSWGPSVIAAQLLQRVPGAWIETAARWRGRSRIIKRLTDFVPDLIRDRDATIQRGAGKGLRFNPSRSAAGFVLGTHDPIVQRAIASLVRSGDVVYDIGANVGFTAVLAARYCGPQGRVICFEPLPENARQIHANAQLNAFSNIDVFVVALGNSDGEADFATSHAPTWGRLTRAGSAPMEKHVQRVSVRNLDAFVQSQKLPLPAFIKIDVEGAEGEVLFGAVRLLRESQPIVIVELHHTNAAVIPLLESCGYRVCPLVPRGDPTTVDREFQIIAYRINDARIEKLLTEVASGISNG